uniref:Uncharacterized protein n=1 Tax=Panagrolaimus sp. PS1159 TaxID=55785 RepID=A0AC35FTP4_9BILA
MPLSAVHFVQQQRPSSDSLSTLRNQIGPIFGAIFLSSVLLQKKPMILPRLKPSTVLPLARSLTISNYRPASQGNPQLFKEINRLAREGKWDAINNAPEPLLRGHAKEEASAVYVKVIQPEDPFSKYGGQPYGPWVFLVTRVAGYFGGLFILCKTYELIVPEQYRLHYKYRPKKHHHDDDGHH